MTFPADRLSKAQPAGQICRLTDVVFFSPTSHNETDATVMDWQRPPTGLLGLDGFLMVADRLRDAFGWRGLTPESRESQRERGDRGETTERD